MNDETYKKLFNGSFQRAIAPDTYGFYKRFFHKLYDADSHIANLFANTGIDRCIKMLIQSMSQMLYYASTKHPNKQIKNIANMHGQEGLSLTSNYYDIWLECMIETIRETDPQFNEDIETAWRCMMLPGVTYLKSYCKT